MRSEALSGLGIPSSRPRPFPTGRSSGKVPPPPKESSTLRLRLHPSTYPQDRRKTSLKKGSGILRRDPTGVHSTRLGKPGRPPRPDALKKQVGPSFPPPKPTTPRRIRKEALDTEPTVCRTNVLKPIDQTAFSRKPVKAIVPTTHVCGAASVPPMNVSWTTTEQPWEDLRLHRKNPVGGEPHPSQLHLRGSRWIPTGAPLSKNRQRPPRPLQPTRPTAPSTAGIPPETPPHDQLRAPFRVPVRRPSCPPTQPHLAGIPYRK